MSLFQFIKSNIPISEYVASLPQTNGFHPVGKGKYRCNNVISGGDNTTSMVVDDETAGGYFKVFSHGNESGDVIKLHQILNNYSNAKEAALSLAESYGVVVPEEYLVLNPESRNKKDIINLLNAVCERAQDYLLDSDSQDAQALRDYLYEERGASKDMIFDWRLGMFPEDVSETRDLITEGFSVEVAQKSGLLSGRRGDFPAMAGRLVFPIFSTSGEVISFSSRVVPGVDTPLEDSKYINTSNTPVYDKSETLFGQHLLKKGIRKVVVCEGNFDVMALNAVLDDDVVAVATCGTALTTSHIDLLKRYTKNIVLFFDSDAAGRKSTAKLLWVSNHVNHLDVISNDSGKDPWEMYQSGGGERIDVDDCVPAIYAATEMMAQDLERDEFISWFVDTNTELNFSDDRAMLLSAAEKYSSLRKNFLQTSLKTRGGLKTSRPRTTQGTSHDLSPGTQLLVSSLLSFGKEERKTIFFPLYLKTKSLTTMELCGVESDDDEKAVRIAMGLDKDADKSLVSMVWNLTPTEQQADAMLHAAAKRIALRISSSIREDSTLKIDANYFSPLNAILSGSSQASGVEQLTFLFDVIADIA